MNETTAVAGALGEIFLYEADEQGRPAGRSTETGDLDFSAVGAKEATVSIPFKKGKAVLDRHPAFVGAVVSAW